MIPDTNDWLSEHLSDGFVSGIFDRWDCVAVSQNRVGTPILIAPIA